MKAFQTHIFIHIDEPLEAGLFATLRSALGKIEGVRDVQPSRRHLLRVDYDPLATRTQAIIGQARKQGLHAQAVGL